MFDSQSHASPELSADDVAGDETGARANLSEGPDTLADMANSQSHASGEAPLGDLTGILSGIFGAGDPAGPNLSLPPYRLRIMFDSKLFPWSDERSYEAEARREAAVAVPAEPGPGPEHVLPVSGGLPDSPRPATAEQGRRQILPDGLDEMAPGPALAASLADIDLSRLTGEDVITVLCAEQRQTSHQQARMYAAMAEAAHASSPTTTERSSRPTGYGIDEIAAAVGYNRRQADRELSTALRLRDVLPEVRAALESGDIDGRKASAISDATFTLKDDVARGAAAKVLPAAARVTVGAVQARLRRLCIQEDPGYARSQYEEHLARRGVFVGPTSEGTADLTIYDCAPHLAQAATDRVNRIARSLKTCDETRTIDQLRADVAIDLLIGRFNPDTGGRGSVNVHVDLSTLARLDDNPADLAGYGPVVSDIARQVAEEQQQKSRWDAVVTDPETGEPLHVVSIKRRPTTRQKNMIRALHPVCVFPGCRMPAFNCDLDHRIDHAQGGPTTVDNHAPLCRHHHIAKHEHGWSYVKTGRTTIEWTSPLGRRHQTGGNHDGGRSPP